MNSNNKLSAGPSGRNNARNGLTFSSLSEISSHIIFPVTDTQAQELNLQKISCRIPVATDTTDDVGIFLLLSPATSLETTVNHLF